MSDDNLTEPTVNETEDDLDFDIEAEIESLRLLEDKAGDIQAQIAAKKQRISGCLKTHRDHVSLRHLLEQCDGLVCAAKVIAQRICDKIGIDTQPSFGYAQMGDSHYQHLISFESNDEKPQQTSRNSTKSQWKYPVSAGKNSTTHQPALLSFSTTKGLDWSNPPSALIRVLGIIASALGLTALIAYIRRRCMSPRSRAERLADREERCNARAYRRAARRADMRRRWDALVAAISCFKQTTPPARIEDYEEKRALILQDAFLEQSLDQAEKGEVMEAEIRELRHAHEIVSSMVRVSEHRYDLITPVNDPPPPLVPLPFTPTSRSRASIGTLPSYTSESLPGYTSRIATEVGSSNSSLIGISLHSPISASSSDQGIFSGSTANSDAGDDRYIHSTPTSSIIDISRPSEDTLRTIHSLRSLHL